MTSPKTYSLQFHILALDEFYSIDKATRFRFTKKLTKRLQNPINRANALSGDLKDCYKLKDQTSGYRLIYRVQEKLLVVMVLSIGKRENLAAYKVAALRLN